MTLSNLRMLIVEDNPGDLRLLKEMLRENQLQEGPVREAGSLAEVEQSLNEFVPELALLDLNLPDSAGPETFERFARMCPQVPVIVLTGVSDERIALATIQRGAQDYLIKGEFDARLLLKSISYSLERHRLNQALSERKREEQQQREQSSLSRMTDPTNTSVSGVSLGIKRLKEVSESGFKSLTDESLRLTELAFEQATLKVDHSLSAQIRDLASSLGRLNAGPKDVIDIYRATLGRMAQFGNPTKFAAMAEEASYVTLELMGYLASFYRDLAGGRATTGWRNGSPDTSDIEA